jgi:excisionase family DNA binding protein
VEGASLGDAGRRSLPETHTHTNRIETMPSAPSTTGRFLTLDDVAAELNISRAQAYAIVRNLELPAIKIGGRGQWRVARDDLETYIAAAFTATKTFLIENPFNGRDDDPDNID